MVVRPAKVSLTGSGKNLALTPTMSPQRIVSLVPHATELLFALGLGERVVGVTHECDFPAAAQQLPKLTKDRLPQSLDQAEIDQAVKASTGEGQAIYELDTDLLNELNPDLIVTQELCPVCAVSFDEVQAAADKLPSCPEVVALDPHTFGETLGDIRTLSHHCDCKDSGVDLLATIASRVDKVKVAVAKAKPIKVAAIEWMDPVMTGGHWTPQLIDYAGGFDVAGFAGERSEVTTWEQLAALEPEVVVCMPCGFDAAGSRDQALLFKEQLASTGAKRAVAVDASSYFSRPGPRLVTGLELLGHILHPTLVPKPAGTDLFEIFS